MLGVGYLLPMNQRENESTIVEVGGKSLRLTHLSKVMFPDDGFTKAELLLYYQTIAPLLLPHLRGRPLTPKAFAHGVKERPYYRRRLASTAPKWLSRVELEDGAAPVVEDAADLLWVVNQDVLLTALFGATLRRRRPNLQASLSADGCDSANRQISLRPPASEACRHPDLHP